MWVSVVLWVIKHVGIDSVLKIRASRGCLLFKHFQSVAEFRILLRKHFFER